MSYIYLYMIIFELKWAGLDSNQRNVTCQIYNLIPLATREPTPIYYIDDII